MSDNPSQRKQFLNYNYNKKLLFFSRVLLKYKKVSGNLLPMGRNPEGRSQNNNGLWISGTEIFSLRSDSDKGV